MIKLSLSFLAGTSFATAAIVMAGGRASMMLGLGFLLACSLGVGVLYWVGVRRLARFLNAFADGLASTTNTAAREGERVRHGTSEGRRAAVAPIDRSGYRKPSAKQQEQILRDTVSEYLTDDIFAPTPAGTVQ
jgi:hypothetical protein